MKRTNPYDEKTLQSLQKLAEELKTNPLGALLSSYCTRKDLQNAYPEVKNGEYERLIKWAISYGSTVDSQKQVFGLYRDWFVSYLSKLNSKDIQTKIVDTSSKLNSLQGEFDKKNAELTEALSGLDTLQKELETRNAELSEALSSLDIAQNDLLQKDSKLSEISVKLTSFENELSQKDSKLVETTSKLNSFQSELDKKGKELEDTSTKLAALQDELVEKDVQISEFLSKLNSVQNELVERDSKLAEASSKLNALQTELQAQIADASSKINSLQDEILRKNSQLSEATLKLADLQSEFDKKNAELTEALSGFDSLKNDLLQKDSKLSEISLKLASLEGDLSLKASKLTEAMSKLTSFRAELSQKESSLAKLSSKLGSLQSKFDKNNAELVKARTSLAETKTHLSQKEASLVKLSSKLNSLQRDFSNKEKALAEAASRIDTLQEEVARKDFQLSDATSKLDSLQSEFDKKGKELAVASSKINSLQDEILRKNSQLSEATLKLADLQSEFDKKGMQLAEASTKLNALQDELVEKDVQISEFLSRLNTIQDELSQKDSKLTEATSKIALISEELRQKNNEVVALRSELEAIRASIVYKTFNKLFRWIDRNFPLDSRRGEFLRLSRTSIAILRQAGFHGFKSSAKEKLENHGFISTLTLTPLDKIMAKDMESKASVNSAETNFADAVKQEVEFAKSQEKLIFQKAKNPKVSIIILNYNKGEYTFNCLSSVLRNTTPGLYEVILVDNASTEEASKEMLKKLKNVKIMIPPENLGFIKGNNYASKQAEGDYILFLNNDTIVLKGWLESLLKTFELHPKVGAAGSKLLYPDGSLQEAGSIVWKDGSAKGLGRNESDPLKPEFNYTREVDFCSGACLMVKKELFSKIGGFNELYAPAYFEDVDLCFQLRSQGYKVLYNPFSVIVHYEGVTSSRDPFNQSGAKKYEIENRPKFVSQWRNELQNKFDPLAANMLFARDLRAGPPVLVIDGWIPEPDKSSGDLRSYNIMKVLSLTGSKLTLQTGFFKESEYADSLREMGVEVIPSSYMPIDRVLKDRAGYYSLAILNTNRMSLALCKHYFYQIRIHDPSIRIALHIDDMFGFAKIIKRDMLRDNSDIENEAEVVRILEKYCLEMLTESEFVFVISEKEEILMRDLVKKSRIIVIPEMREPIPPDEIAAFKERNSIVYVGGFSHAPNLGSAKILLNDVMPLVWKQLPNLKVYIVGNSPPPELTSIMDERIKITGFVKDLSYYYKMTKVSVAPIVAKGGIKGKIVESLNYGTPVVTNSLGIDGTQLEDGKNILVGNTPIEMASKIIRLFKDEKHWTEISQNGRKYFEDHSSTLLVKSVMTNFISTMQPTNNLKLGAAAGIAQKYDVEAPLAVLLLLYNERADLQNAFPEVKNSQYSRLIEWAGKYGTTVDSHKSILSPYKDWFVAQVPADK